MRNFINKHGQSLLISMLLVFTVGFGISWLKTLEKVDQVRYDLVYHPHQTKAEAKTGTEALNFGQLFSLSLLLLTVGCGAAITVLLSGVLHASNDASGSSGATETINSFGGNMAATLTVTCSECGEQVYNDDVICPFCGADLLSSNDEGDE